MKELKGTRTETNLMAAFSAESMARVKYGFYGEKAHDDGYVQIGDIFDETASNENEHAEIWFKLLSGGKIRGTADNLAGGDHIGHQRRKNIYACHGLTSSLLIFVN